MLTPDKIREKSFQTTGRGSYRAEDVDSFLNEVSASYEQMFKENGDLIKKISILAKKVEEYRADEESLKLALLNAQKLADRIVAEAKENAEKDTVDAKAEAEKLRADAKADADEAEAKAKRESDAIIESAKAEAEKIVKEANRQSDEILGNINRKVTHETLVYDMVKKEASEFKAKLVAMYKEHINLINQLPEIVDEQLDKAEPAPVAEEPAEVVEEEPVVIEEAAPVAIEDVEEEIEVVAEPEAEIVEETVEEEIAEEVEETPAEPETEVAEIVEEEPAAPVKKPFKLDLSKIDFADEETPAPAPAVMNTVEVEDEPEEDKGSISFKNFFKKK